MITCSLCQTATVKDTSEAIEKDWAPEWFETNDPYESPKEAVCPACQQFMTTDSVDGTLVLDPGINFCDNAPQVFQLCA